MAQDFYDALQPFEYIYDMLDTNKAVLGLAYIARHDEELIPEYPAVLLQMDSVERRHHATGLFYIEFNLDLWVFHAQLSVNQATRSLKDIQLATAIRKLLHSDRQLGGHIIFGYVNGEFPGVTARVISGSVATIVTTRLTWTGENRVPFDAS